MFCLRRLCLFCSALCHAAGVKVAADSFLSFCAWFFALTLSRFFCCAFVLCLGGIGGNKTCARFVLFSLELCVVCGLNIGLNHIHRWVNHIGKPMEYIKSIFNLLLIAERHPPFKISLIFINIQQSEYDWIRLLQRNSQSKYNLLPHVGSYCLFCTRGSWGWWTLFVQGQEFVVEHTLLSGVSSVSCGCSDGNRMWIKSGFIFASWEIFMGCIVYQYLITSRFILCEHGFIWCIWCICCYCGVYIDAVLIIIFSMWYLCTFICGSHSRVGIVVQCI